MQAFVFRALAGCAARIKVVVCLDKTGVAGVVNRRGFEYLDMGCRFGETTFATGGFAEFSRF